MSDHATPSSPIPAGPAAPGTGRAGNERTRPWWHAALVIIVGYAVAAVPAFFLLMIAAFGFSGCFLECREPDPAQGWVGVAGLVLVLSAPVFAAVAYMKRSRLIWIPVALLLTGALFTLL